MSDSLFELICSRQSVGRLVAPAPNAQQLEHAISAALTAPDHQRLRPWRFVVIEAEHRRAFGERLAQCLAKEGEQDALQLKRIAEQPLRAPMLLVCLLHYQANEKVPRYEQLLSCGAAIQNLLLSLHEQGFASIWRTGQAAWSAQVRQALGGKDEDEIVGIIYIGHAENKPPSRQPLAVSQYLTPWTSSF